MSITISLHSAATGLVATSPAIFSPAMDRLKDLSYDDFSKFLEAEGAHEDIIRTFSDNRISGEAFLSLEEDLKELVPVIGDRIFVRKLLQQAREASEAVPMVCYLAQSQCVPCSNYIAATMPEVYVLLSCQSAIKFSDGCVPLSL